MLKRCLDDNRDIAREVMIDDSKERLGDQPISVCRKLVMFESVRVYVTLFNLIAAYQWHVQTCTEFPGKSRLPRSRPARDYDALWFSGHVKTR